MDNAFAIQATPPKLSGWSDWKPITRMRSLYEEREFYFPPDMLPSSKIGISNEFDSSAIWIDAAELNITGRLSITPMIAGFLAGIGGIPVGLVGRSSRTTGTYYSVSGAHRSFGMCSPRFGFSIDKIFKHQAYIKLDFFAFGITGPNYQIYWMDVACVPQIEFSTNCRMKRYLVSHGKVLGTKISKDTQEKTTAIYLKICDNTQPCMATLSGEITIWGIRSSGYQTAKFPIKGITADWYVQIDPPVEKDGEEVFIPATGDFYMLDKTIVAEDPQLLHEFDVVTPNYAPSEVTHIDDLYSKEQSSGTTDNQIVGIWLYDETKQKWIAYVNKADSPGMDTNNTINWQSKVHLPENDAQSAVAGEDQEFGGSLDEGIEAFNKLDPRPAVVRLVLDKAIGSSTMQNFYAGNLKGGYISVESEFYEIVDHPRLDTIEILNSGMQTGTELITSDMKSATSLRSKKISVYQQYFWQITELYTSYYQNDTGALWGGAITEIEFDKEKGTTTITWRTRESNSKLALSANEMNFSQCLNLAERFRTEFNPDNLKDKCVMGFRKFQDWRIMSMQGKSFKIYDMLFTELGDPREDVREFEVTALCQGNPSQDLSIGNDIYVVLGEPYQSALGLWQPGNISLNLGMMIGQTGPSGQPPNFPYLLIHGRYEAGLYDFPEVLDPKKRLAIASHDFGLDGGNWFPPRPSVWVSAYTGLRGGACFVEHGASHRQTLIYRDPELDILAAISTDLGGIERRQKIAIRCGLSEKKSIETGVPDGASYITGMYGDITPSTTSSLKTFWCLTPLSNTNTASPYYSIKIQGYAGIDTPYTRKIGLSIPMTASHPVDLPIENYEPTPIASNKSKISYGVPVIVAAKSVDLTKCGFEEIIGKDKLEKLSQGIQLDVTKPSIPATHFEYSKMRQMLHNVNQFSAHAVSNGDIYMFYGQDTGQFAFSASPDSTTINQSKPGLFVIKTSTNMDDWGSPKFNRSRIEKLGTPDEKKEWERPLMLAYDFEFANSVALSDDTFAIFGYGYGKNADGIVQTGNKDYFFLGMYVVSLPGLTLGTTYATYYAGNSDAPSDDEKILYYYRPNYVTNGKTVNLQFDMGFGTNVLGLPNADSADTESKTKSDPANLCVEKFTRIIGGKDSGAMITNYKIAREVIGVEASNGMLSIYLKTTISDDIYKVSSCACGGRWTIDMDDSNPPKEYVYAVGSSPTVFGSMLFYFHGDVLYCKNLNLVSDGVFPDRQAGFDGLQAGKVATDILPHKVAISVDPSGVIVVFYLSKSGYITSSMSSNSGKTWEYGYNW
jgi:hypothetical protein